MVSPAEQAPQSAVGSRQSAAGSRRAIALPARAGLAVARVRRQLAPKPVDTPNSAVAKATAAGARPRVFYTTRLVHALTSRRALMLALVLVLVAGLCAAVAAQGGSAAVAIPKVSLGVDASKSPKDIAVTLQVLLLLTVLTIAPSLLIMTTAFTRIVIVLSITRNALGLPQIPPNQVLIGLAMFLTFFVMRPTFEQINDTALQPYMSSKITFEQGVDRAVKPLRSFMIRQTYRKDLAFFVDLARLKTAPKTEADLPVTVVVPAFMTSELKTAFVMGFYIYLPFLIIDIVVASTMMSMGMMMLPPTVVSIPAKLLLFVMADGWTLLLGSLVKGFKL